MLKAQQVPGPFPSRYVRSSRRRGTVQFETPKPPMRPRGHLLEQGVRELGDTEAGIVAVQHEDVELRSRPSRRHALSTSAPTRSGLQCGGWQPFA